MKILFVLRHSGYMRNFEWTLRALGERRHQVHLAFQLDQPHAVRDRIDVTGELCARYPRFSRSAIPTRDDGAGRAAEALRAGLDYLRYLEPAYANATKLRARAERDAPAWLVRRAAKGLSRAERRVLAWSMRRLHDAIPSDARIDAFIEAHGPDLLVVTPLIEPGSPQAEYVRSARRLGVRTALCVASWDNLTNKGLIHGDVDLVTVWNPMMQAEAVTLHGVPPARVSVTGAHPFDHWFTWQPSTTREQFCARIGLPPDRPFILYLCSSKFIAPEEVAFVRQWLSQLRQSPPPALQDVGVLIRPHPQNAEPWAEVSFDGLGPVVLWPREGATPADASARAEYFDSMFHSAAVVAVNTTAEIESAIVGRPVFTVLAPEFREAQEGTPHFHHLRDAGSGLITLARTLEEHFVQLAAALDNPHFQAERCRAFVDAFVRPFGRDTAATPKLVAALEALASRPPRQRSREPRWAPLVHPALTRRGSDLLRHESRVVQTKAILARKKMRKAQAASPPPHAGAAVHVSSGATRDKAVAVATPVGAPGIPSWKDVAEAYRRLGSRDRLRFGRATGDVVPGELRTPSAPERLDYSDAEIYLRVTTKAERNRLKACAKEPFTIEWLHAFVQSGDVLYDIGANVGAYSLVAAKKPGGGARVVAFEPSYATMASLCANIVINNAADQITPMPFALSDRVGMTVFGLRALEPGSARHTLGDSPSAEGPPLYRQPVMTFALDDLIERFGLPQPNHIKLDVDGGELAVLAGAARALASPALRSMLVEVSTSLSEDIVAALAERGLQLESKINVKNKAGEYLVWYGLFTRQAREAGVAPDVRVQHFAR